MLDLPGGTGSFLTAVLPPGTKSTRVGCSNGGCEIALRGRIAERGASAISMVRHVQGNTMLTP